MRTVLVTGGCGFLGRHLVRALLARGDRVQVLDNLLTSRLDTELLKQVQYFLGSVTDPSAVRDATRGVDLIVHMASVVGKRLAHEQWELAYKTSAMGAHELLDSTDVPMLAFSSSAVYGVAGPSPSREDDDVDPWTYDHGRLGYACGKQAMEHCILEDWRPAACVRPFNVVGPGQVGDYGMVLPRFVDAALRGHPLVVYGDGEQTRSFSHVGTFTDVIVRMLDRLDDSYQIVNVGTPTATTINELARKVLAATGSTSRIEYRPYADVFGAGALDVRHRVPDTTRLTDLLGPIAWPTIDDIIEEVVRSKR